jgi:3-hydroxyacyl-CoA dehydrogenase/enoyl-CoA hydratase/3-hydroxybutyryl-CoA epimerase
MGPMELIDEVGIDVGEKVSHILFDAYGARMKGSELSRKVLETGRLGKKNGRGFYLYSKNRKGALTKKPDPELAAQMGITPKPHLFSALELVERCILPMINEAARALSEGVVENAGEVDLGMIMGTGFPPFRGGLLRYADSLGIGQVVERLSHHARTYGARFEPCSVLLEMNDRGQNFAGRFGSGDGQEG